MSGIERLALAVGMALTIAYACFIAEDPKRELELPRVTGGTVRR